MKDKWVLGYTENGEWADNSMQIVVWKKQGEFQVLKLIRSRPAGTQFGIGNLFNEVGLAQSGLFCGRKLLKAFDVPNIESGFMGISGKHTEYEDGGIDHQYFGEHNDNDKLHGRGIYICSDGFIHIRYWDDGEYAPGNNLYIDSDGSVSVGELYLKDGKRCYRGTCYRTDGSS